MKILSVKDPAFRKYGGVITNVNFTELVEEMKKIGIADAFVDDKGYVYGTIPATKGKEDKPVIGFIAHASSLRHSFALIAVFGLMTAVLARFLRRN